MGYPIQCVNTKFGITCFMNYNNYYSILGNYVAYYGSASFDIPSWYQTTAQDSNSISMLPHYIDTAKHLQLTNYIQLECPISPLVGIDILDSIRIGITAMGCYTPSRLNFDIISLGADNWLLSKPANQSTYVDAVFMNIGPMILESIIELVRTGYCKLLLTGQVLYSLIWIPLLV